MKISVALGLGMCLFFGANPAVGDESLQGTWTLVQGEVNGEPLTETQLQEGKLVIDGDHYEVSLPDQELMTGVQVLDEASGVKTIDITGDNGAGKGQTCLGLYELDGDEFRVAFAPPGKDRPSEMTTPPGSGHWLHVWKRDVE
ncbi:hypothetical protein Pla108_33590 [Botrimarina colliarenosi]|uniref:TIGR03067 domain-containing protein n=1 Tax=Botrimarina colliarenosi TaxID=2528001 RepID=A0A5C6A703_9BACT|nr:TIGR03067 domain-containing protein [Botrimarina colliarenosi]TWT95216.1 hypothetical protein Pla108_33590 [Botrimarina colliarenosi]